MSEVEETMPSSMELLKRKAKQLGVTFSNNISEEKLREKVNAAMEDSEPKEEPISEARQARLEMAAKRKRIADEALKLVRIRLSCHNPAKKEWPGEIITVGNKLLGTHRKMVPFHMSEEGYHVPQIILNVLKERKFQQFYTVKLPNGDEVRRGRLVPEFNIEVLPPLTEKQLKELAERQLKSGSLEGE